MRPNLASLSLMVLALALVVTVLAHSAQAQPLWMGSGQAQPLTGIMRCETAQTWPMEYNRMLLDGRECVLLLDDVRLVITVAQVDE